MDQRQSIGAVQFLECGAKGVLYRLCLNSPRVEHVVVSLMNEGKYGPLLENAGVKVYCLGMKPGKITIKQFFQLVSFIRTEKPDAVQTWMYHADLLGGVAAKIAGVRKVFWCIRHSTLEKGKAKRSTIAIAKLCALLSRFVPSGIVCCAHKALVVHRDIGYAARKLVVIPNGYDLTKFTPDEHAGANLRVLLGVPQRIFLIGKVGRYDPFKDHNNLLVALSGLNSLGIDFKCLLVGTGLTKENELLLAPINELGLIDKVLLAGPRTDIPAVMNALDLHVLSSSSEGFPNVLAEAMACGTPAVSTDVGDAIQIVGDAALLCPPRDPQELGGLIRKMHREWAEDSEAWSGRKTQCIEHIKSNFSIERMVVLYEQCWFSE
jgi:glycosyltransferase involved in cell wall biosynthesis